jgi:hypothetical protein
MVLPIAESARPGFSRLLLTEPASTALPVQWTVIAATVQIKTSIVRERSVPIRLRRNGITKPWENVWDLLFRCCVV